MELLTEPSAGEWRVPSGKRVGIEITSSDFS